MVGSGNISNMCIGGYDPRPGYERDFVLYVWRESGYGARPGKKDNHTAMSLYSSGTRNEPVELMDRMFPVLSSRYGFITDSAGAGYHRGGHGVSRDLVLTHSRDDRHQDHRVVNEVTWNAFRSHQILEYEIPKWDGDLQRPNVYVPAEPELLDRKIALLLTHFGSQRSKHWFDDETFRALARLRGLECNARYAEAFVARKLVLG